MALLGRDGEGETTERQYAAMAEKLGRKLEAGLGGGKAQLLKALKDVSDALGRVGQGEHSTEMKTLPNVLVLKALLNHSDKDVRLYTALCLSDVLRIFAPREPYEDDETLKGVYSAFLDALHHLDDPSKSAFICAQALLQNIATIGLCVPMLDLECEGADSLVVELFQVLFKTISPMNSPLVEEDVTKVLSTMLEEAEEVSPEVLHTILERLVQPCKGENPAAHTLACNLIRKSENTLQISVQHFLTDALSTQRCGTGELDHPPLCRRYADILEAVAITDSTSLVTVWPIIMDELQSDDTEVRTRAVKLFGRILAAPGCTVARDFGHYLQQFLRRFDDRKTEIRVEMAKWGSSFLLGFGDEDVSVAKEVVGHFNSGLGDWEEKVRLATVSAVCDVAEALPRLVDVELLRLVGVRMRCKKNSVRQLVLKRLASVYRAYVARYADADPPQSESERFDWIPSHLFKGCAVPDIRHHIVEPILADLFPPRLSMERRSFFWLHAIRKQDKNASRTFTFLMRNKLHVQTCMRDYLTIRQKHRASQQSQSPGDGVSGEKISDELSHNFVAVGQNFPDPGKAASCMERLHAMKDGNIFRGLSSLLKVETTATDSQTIAEDILKRIGSKHPAYEWARLLLVKITQQPFGREHVCRMLDFVASPVAANDEGSIILVTSALEHLVQLARSAPHTFQGTAKELSGLISHRDQDIVAAACKITADAANCLDVTGAHQAKICARLKLLCVEGTRIQAKHAAMTLAKLATVAGVGREHLQDVFEGIVDAAGDDDLLGSNLPGVLATIQVVGQRTPELFMEHLQDIEKFIVGDLLTRPLPLVRRSRGISSISTVAELQAWGLKALAKGCGRPCPAPGGEARASFVQRVLGVLRAALSPPDEQAARLCSAADLTHLRVAAGKAVLVIARTDPAAVTPDLFISTSLLIRDAPAEMIAKLQHGIINYGLMQGYAAPLALTALYGDAAARTASRNALGSIVAHVRRRAANVRATAVNSSRPVDSAMLSRTLLIHSAEYVLPYLIFLLAHHPELPSKDVGAQDGGTAYRPFEQAISLAITALTAGTTGECLPAACKIMRKLKSMVDTVDADKSHGIYVLSDIALLILHQASTQKGWDTGPYPGQVPLPIEYFTLMQRPVVSERSADCRTGRVGDFSHLPVGFTVQLKNQVVAAKHGDKRGGAAAAGARSKPAAARATKKATAIRSKPTTAPSRTLPSRAARKGAIVDAMDGDFSWEDDAGPPRDSGDKGATHQGSYGIRTAPPVALLAPAGWDSDANAADGDDEDTEEEEEEEKEEKDSPPVIKTGNRKKSPLADRKNTPPRFAGGGTKLASPGMKLLNSKRKENAVADVYDPEGLTEGARVSKQRRR